MVNATRETPRRFRQIDALKLRRVIGVDFSGAALSGKTAWAAEMTSTAPLRIGDAAPQFQLVSLKPLGKLAAGDERQRVNEYLVDRIVNARQTFWGCDFPFGLPIELRLGDWGAQLSRVGKFAGQAAEFGRWLVERTEKRVGRKHVRRSTDSETKTPFDCYHYRIIYQTFHGMRDVLRPLSDQPSVCVLPFQYDRLPSGRVSSLVVEACPSSTLKRWRLPHQHYKQSGGKAPLAVHRATRRVILKQLSQFVQISPYRRRQIMNDPGGDALDAVLSGVGAWLGVAAADHNGIRLHSRYDREGYVYC
ncbi:DUF429 domain-containing protein [Stieleria sp. TO1_6]|nr:DUF429 domain-containing protein [Stieleria tagensis]